MTSPIILAFCAPGPMRETLRTSRRTDPRLYGVQLPAPSSTRSLAGYRSDCPDVPLILLGVGADGCAALAKCVEEDGLEGVLAVVLIDPQAPWAEKWRSNACPPRVAEIGSALDRLPLNSLEPLRALAKMAMGAVDAEPCERHGRYSTRAFPSICRDCEPARLIIACHPERAVCVACGGTGRRRDQFEKATGGMGRCSRTCSACSGTGGALGSHDIAKELSSDLTLNDVIRWRRTVDDCEVGGRGGVTVLRYETRAFLEQNALVEALGLVMNREHGAKLVEETERKGRS